MRLNREQVRALRRIKYGADIKDRKLAEILRSIEAEHPTFITITDPMGVYPVNQMQPYFGAIATKAGLEAISERQKEVAA